MSDDEAPTRKRVTKKPDSDDDEAPTTKRSAAPRAAKGSDDDDAAPTTRARMSRNKGGDAAKTAKKDDDSSDDDGDTAAKTAAMKAAAANSHMDPMMTIGGAGSSVGGGIGASTFATGEDVGIISFNIIDYDAMTYDQFVAHLATQSKADRLAEWARHEESVQRMTVNEADDDNAERDIQNFTDGNGGYGYKFLLNRIMSMNPRQDGSGEVKIPAPKLEKLGSKRTVIVNFDNICKSLHRDMEDVKDFIEKQLTISSSIDANGCWVGRVQNVKQTQVEHILQKYITQYVQCQMCWSADTELKKDTGSRLTYLTCKKCGASRTVTAQAQASYKAQTTKRARQRVQ